MDKNKDEVLIDFIKMIEQSWTYKKLTEFEKKQFYATFNHIQTTNTLKGTYKQRWEILQLAYRSFLNGCGYDGCTWRD